MRNTMERHCLEILLKNKFVIDVLREKSQARMRTLRTRRNSICRFGWVCPVLCVNDQGLFFGFGVVVDFGVGLILGLGLVLGIGCRGRGFFPLPLLPAIL